VLETMLFDRAADARQGNGSAILAELEEGTSQGVDAEMEYNTVNWREPHMKTLTGLLLLAVSAAISPAADPVRLNPKRFSAAEIRQEGDVAHLHGNVVVKGGGLIIYGEDSREEIDEKIARGVAQIDRGETIDGEEAFRRLRAQSAFPR
jgi:hypothetical protein